MTNKTIDRLLLLLDSETEDCVIWDGASYRFGHGHINVRGIDFAVHRMIWEILRGPIPAGIFVCHHCDVPACGNIRHLFLGTQKENLADMWKKGRGGPRSYPRPWLRGEANINSKLTNAQARAIRRLAEGGVPHYHLANLYSVHIATIRRIVNRKTWAID